MIEIPRVRPVKTPVPTGPDEAGERVQETERSARAPADLVPGPADRRQRQERRRQREPRPDELDMRQKHDRRHELHVDVDA